MIAHNGKQVTIAMRGRKPINLIARNGKVMFGDFSAISEAAKAVILAEYGLVVWGDVRDYAKAHPAIVPFINQDPHLACSISTNSNKERWLVGDGKAYIKTDIVAPNGHRARYKFKIPTNASKGYFVGIHETAPPYYAQVVYWTGSQLQFGHYNQFPDVYAATKGNTYEIDGDWRGTTAKLSVNGSVVADTADSNPKSQTEPICVFTCGYGIKMGFIIPGEITPIFIEMEDGTEHHLLPTIHQGQAGMVDAISGTFHPNANTEGAFTIQITDKQ